MVEKIGNYWKDGLSILEAKVSALLIIFIISSIYSLFHAWHYGDISSNLSYFLIALGGYIFGKNVSEDWKDVKMQETYHSGRKNREEDNQAKG